MDLISSEVLPTFFSLPLIYTGLLHSTIKKKRNVGNYFDLIRILDIYMDIHCFICPKSLKLSYLQTMALYSRDRERELFP